MFESSGGFGRLRMIVSVAALGALGLTVGGQAQEQAGALDLPRLEIQGTVQDVSVDGAVLMEVGDVSLLLPDDLEFRGGSTSRADDEAVASEDLAKDASAANVVAGVPEEESQVASDQREGGIFILQDPWSREAESADEDTLDLAAEYGDEDPGAADASEEDVDLEVAREEAGKSSQLNRVPEADVQVGDSVTAVVPAGSAEVVALENGVVTLRSGDEGLLQVPLEALPAQVRSSARVRVQECGGEASMMTLDQAGRAEDVFVVASGDLTEWRANLATHGVIASSQPDRLLILAPVQGELQLVSAPPPLRAGEAVRLGEAEEFAVEAWRPAARLGLLSHPDVEVSGEVVRQVDGAVVLRTDTGETLMLSDDLAFQPSTFQPGSEVSVRLPAGEADVLAVGDGVATLRSGEDLVQVPLASIPEAGLEADGFAARSDLDAWESGMSGQGVVLGEQDGDYVVHAMVDGQMRVLSVPGDSLAAGQSLRPGSTVSLSSQGDRVVVEGWTDTRAGSTSGTAVDGGDSAVSVPDDDAAVESPGVDLR